MVDVYIDKRVIEKMLEILGPNGEHWTKGREARRIDGEMTTWQDPNAVCYCLMGAEYKALAEVKDVDRDEFFRWFLYLFRNYLSDKWDFKVGIPTWNDAEERTWEEVKTFLEWVLNFEFKPCVM